MPTCVEALDYMTHTSRVAHVDGFLIILTLFNLHLAGVGLIQEGLWPMPWLVGEIFVFRKKKGPFRNKENGIRGLYKNSIATSFGGM